MVCLKQKKKVVDNCHSYKFAFGRFQSLIMKSVESRSPSYHYKGVNGVFS